MAGHAPSLAMLGVQAPAHTRLVQPIIQLADIDGAQTKSLTHRLNLKQTQPVVKTPAQLRQLQQALQGLHQGVGMAGVVGHRIRQLTAEHRVDMRRKNRHIRHHDHDVRGLQAGVGIQPSQELVMQDFHLALRRMGLHKQDAVIGSIER